MKEVWIGKIDMKKLKLDFPIIRFIDSNEKAVELNMQDFINHKMPDLNSPYRKILLPEIFNQAYVLNDKLVWDNVLEMTMCGGDSKWMAAEFGERELL